MTYEFQEESRYLGEPVDLYLFKYGPAQTDVYAYCDAEQPITITLVDYDDPITFTPHPLMRDAIKSSGTLDKSALKVSLDAASDVCELFKVYPPTQEVVLIIREGHIGDPDEEFGVIWTGRVLSCRWVDSVGELTCEPVATSMRRAAMRSHYQYGCRHALYQGDDLGGCHASQAAATSSATIAAIDGVSVTLTGGWEGSFAPDKYRGGMLKWINANGAPERRTILRVAGDVLTVTGVIRDLDPGDTIDVVLGCNHQMTDCKDLHDAILDFGGDPWIPTKNPIGSYNNFV